MILARRALSGSLAAILAVATWGCGEDKPSTESSTTEAKVTGTVMIHGKPMTSGELRFNPQNYSAQGRPGPEGDHQQGWDLRGHDPGRPERGEYLGPRDHQGAATGIRRKTIDVKDGTNTLNIELPPPSQAAGDAAKTSPPQ